MSNIFDDAKNLLKSLQNKATPLVSPVQQPVAPKYDLGVQINRMLPQISPAIGNFLHSSQSFQLPQLPKPIANTPVLGGIAQFGRTSADSIISQGILNPAADIGRFATAALTNQPTPSYNQLKSPQARIGQQITQHFTPQFTKGLGVSNTSREMFGNVAGVVNPILNAWGGGLPMSIGKTALKEGGKVAIKDLVTKGAAQQGAVGGITGMFAGLEAGRTGDEQKAFNNTVLSTIAGAGLGAVTGGVLAGAGGVAGAARANIIKLLKGKYDMSESQAAKAAGNFLRDELGRFTKKPEEEVLAAGQVSRDVQKRLDKGQWGSLNPPKINDDIREYFNLPKDYQTGSIMIPGKSKSVTEEVKPALLDVTKDSTSDALSDTMGQQTGLKLPPQGSSATTEQKLLSQASPLQPVTGAGQPSIPGNSTDGSSPPDISTDPVQKIIQALKEAKPIRGAQEALYSAERSKRAGAVAGIGKNVPGEGGYFAQLGALKGQLPKAQFEGIRNQIKQPDIDHLFNSVEQAGLSPFEKITAKGGLAKLLGAEGGTVPNRSELSLLNEVFPPEFIQAALSKRSLMQKALTLGEGALNLPRAIMSTLDLSAPLRQGVFLVGRPKQFLPAFKDMFKYAFNENSYKGLQENIKARPTYPLMREAKLAITDGGPLLESREEAFMSNLVDNIPGFGALSKGSNRAYSGFLNKLRADTFDDLVKNAKSQGIAVEGKTLDDIGKFVNSATGRGTLPNFLKTSGPVLNGLFFSPRLMASRINMLNPQYYVSLDPFVRKEALKSLLTFGATAGTVLGLAKMGGADVGTDPRSADFGKIKAGNTRYDILGGFQQYIKLAAQLRSGQIISSTTGKTINLGEGYKPLTRKDIISRFFEGKEAPVASFVTSMLTGTNSVGDDFNLPTEVINRFIPLMTQDIYDLAKDKDNIGQALAMAIPGILGVGSQTYGKTELVKGQNPIGEPTTQIRPVPGLADQISENVFGKQPLGSSSSYNVETYYNQLLKMPKQEAAAKFTEISKTNPDLAKQIIQVVKDRQNGVTIQDKNIKGEGVSSGQRATDVVKEFNKLKTPQEKAKLWDHYVKIGVITPDVARQMKILLNK